jgi:acyl-CoA thioesterase FadM
MSQGFAMIWPVRQIHTVTAADLDAGGDVSDEALERWVSAACSEYLDRCSVLESLRAQSGLRLVRRDVRLPRGARLRSPDTVVASSSAPEVRPSSFTLAVRLRPRGGDEAGRAIDTTSLVWLEDPATGEAAHLGKRVRDQLISIERSARHHN